VSWSHAASPGDAVTIVPADAPAGKIGQHFRVGHLRSGALPVPRAPGAYEVRYVSQGEALARLPVAVTQPSVTLTGPETAEPGTRFEVAWDTVVGLNDVLTLVPAAAPETQIAATIGVSRNGTAVLQAPLGAGAYEVRYILSPDGRVLARWPFTVVTANQPASGADRTGQITLTVPERAGAGETIAVGWDGPSGQRDRLAIASPDQPATRWLRAIAAGEGGRADVALPDQAGSYEIRYIDLENREILATAPIVVE